MSRVVAGFRCRSKSLRALPNTSPPPPAPGAALQSSLLRQYASWIAWLAPCPRKGGIACAASPMSTALAPLVASAVRDHGTSGFWKSTPKSKNRVAAVATFTTSGGKSPCWSRSMHSLCTCPVSQFGFAPGLPRLRCSCPCPSPSWAPWPSSPSSSLPSQNVVRATMSKSSVRGRERVAPVRAEPLPHLTFRRRRAAAAGSNPKLNAQT
mmetsp:Transcript_27310/g.55902  ORF Transcript_27310/g.55902 Transcript_27310/m.55902 type:complete len:209 (-) Transcript_27310:807-1433(-)